MAVFDFMKHEKSSFEAAIDKFRKEKLDAEKEALEIVYLDCKLGPQTVGLAAGCQVVCIFVNDNANAEVLTLLASQGVKLLTLRCAGFDNVDLKAASALDITVTRVPAYSPYAVAEFAATLCMSLNRKIVSASGRVRQGNFSLANLVGFDLYGKTVGVIGTGKIGQCFIKIMQGFGCQVLLYDAYPSKEVAGWENCKYVELDELLAKSKIISLHCPLLPSTKHLINQESIAKMQKGVVLINTSRGGLVNTQHLIQALKSGHVSAAGLDVYENERSLFFEDHSGSVMEDDAFARLLSFSNVIVTGHQAFLTEEALDKIASVTVDNIYGYCVDGLRGKALENVVM
ncbi:D-isomer specific 2-hydroxyacid dehydrogenase [Chytridium lagenaria]|nr:D-isomer specific 2-hydroxyacid dehydrogenase [Chytridium lagenaria]